MPWDTSQVDKFKKGLTQKQKERWIRIANQVLESCLEEGGNQSTCEERAIKQANGVVGNMKQNTIIIHKLDNAEVKEVEKNGKKYLVSPVVAVQEAVLNGQLAPEEELKTFVDAWNDIPIIVNHPKRRGQHVSAKHQEIVESEVIGRFYNVNWDDGKLKGKIWVDVEKAESLAENNEEVADALEKLKDGEPMNVSTAYFSNVEDTEGTFNGQEYKGIQRDIRPDHLALLPNEKGACSLEDGCGTPKVNFLRGDEKISEKEEVEEVEEENVIANKLGQLIKLFRKNIEEEGDENMAEKEEVITQIKEYECNSFSKDELEEKELDELKTYEGLLAMNCQDDEEEPETNEEETETNEEEETEEEVETNEEGENIGDKIEEYLKDNIGIDLDELKEIVDNEKQSKQEKREKLTDNIVNNQDLNLTKEDCEGMKLNALEKLADTKVVANYSGKAAPKVVENEDNETIKSKGVFLNEEGE